MSLPINLRIAGRRVVVVGGGRIAQRKIAPLIAAGAHVVVIAPAISSDIRRMLGGGAELLERPYRSGDLASAVLVFATADDAEVNGVVARDAHALGIFVNDTSAADRSDFTTPAIHRLGTLTFAVDSDGAAPAFVRRLRAELVEHFDPRYEAALASASRVRDAVHEEGSGSAHTAIIALISSLDITALAELEGEELAALGRRALAGLRCASRASALATTQTALVTEHLQRAGIRSSVVPISTKGDQVQDRSIAAIGGESLFVKELERALAEGRADYAVHSCKDLPSQVAPGMRIAAFTERADPRDVFCSEKYPSLADLPAGARVGTSSPRRRALLQAQRADLRYEDIRGNIDTRLRKLREGEYDAIVLAAAGLDRLGIRATHMAPFEATRLIPAAGQGMLAIECRAGDRALAALLRHLCNDASAELEAIAERTCLAALGGGCSLPIGVHAIAAGGGLTLHAVIANLDGSQLVRATRRGSASAEGARELGCGLAAELREAGGAEIVRALAPAAPRLDGRLVVLPRTLDRPSRVAPALRASGAEVVELGDTHAGGALAERAPDMVLIPSSGAVGAVTEYLRALHARGQRPCIAAMGPESSASAAAAGFPPDVVSPCADVETFVATVSRYLSELAS